MPKCIFFYVFLVFIVAIYGHQLHHKQQSDAELQSALMPQELNPAFVSEKDSPWRAVLPILPRRRRETEAVVHIPTTVQKYKVYSRLAACIALAFAAVVEIVLYVVEFYNTSALQ